MVKKKKAKSKNKKEKKSKQSEESEKSSGVSLDDAFSGDEDVEYAPSKPPKIRPKKMSDEEIEEDLEEAEEEVEEISKSMDDNVVQVSIKIKASKPITKIKKGDRIKIDGQEYQVDQHYILIDHGTTKEMAIELFDKNDKDYQLRYFSDQAESTIEFYELQEIMFVKKRVQTIEW